MTVLAAGGGVELRPIGGADAEAIWTAVDTHRDDLRAWLPWVDQTSSVADCRRFAHQARSDFEHMRAFNYGMYVDGAFGGTIGTHAIDWQNFNTTIGYWLAPPYRGHGVATRAAAVLIDYAIATFRIHRFEIECVVENTTSRRIPERLDFVFEAVLADRYYLHERFRDIALYGMTATRWAAVR